MRGARKTGALYRNRLLMLCLCQGGAEHFVRGRRGVKDLDVWEFFRAHPIRPFPSRRCGVQDFGPSRLGRHPEDAGFAGRRVDVIGRSIACAAGRLAADCVLEWLRSGRTKSARLIAQRPLVVIHPENALGDVIWDTRV